MNLATVLRRWRIMADLSQKSVADMIGIEPNALGRFEKEGAITTPNFMKILTWLTSEGNALPKQEPLSKAVQQSIGAMLDRQLEAEGDTVTEEVPL